MLKKTIKYTDFDGNVREEDFWFNLTKAEIAEMELSQAGGLEKYYEKIIKTQNQPKLVEIFKSLILKSYGEKSDDGRRFVKSPELTQAFTETQAYSDLFMELASNADSALAFCRGIMPADMANNPEVAKAAANISSLPTVTENN